MERFVIDETANTLFKYNHHDGIKYLEDRACKNAHIISAKLPSGLNYQRLCF